MKKLAFSLIFIILFTILLAGLPETLALHIAILFQWNLAAVGVMVLIQEMLMLFFILYLLKRANLVIIYLVFFLIVTNQLNRYLREKIQNDSMLQKDLQLKIWKTTVITLKNCTQKFGIFGMITKIF